MDDDAVRDWLRHRLGVSRETLHALEALADSVAVEAEKQNLISASTLGSLWQRHILDSAQLFPLGQGRWVDLGSGAGFPGLVLGVLGANVTLVEARRLRCEWLRKACDLLHLSNVTVVQARVEVVRDMRFDTLTARAFAPLPRLFDTAWHLSTPTSRWLLPKGRRVREELASLGNSWQGDFEMIPSLSDPDGTILRATSVRRGGSRRA